jgi:hypothetical protein
MEPTVLHGLQASVESSTVRAEAVARRRVMLEVALETLESGQAHKVRANTLSGLLLHLQALVKHAYTKVVSGLSDAQKMLLHTDTDPLLDVVTMTPGSFRLLLEAAEQPDLFGYGEITRALSAVDEITAVAGNPEETLLRLRRYRGHTVGAYLRLLRFMVQSGVSMRYAWASPDMAVVSGNAISLKEAEPLVTALTASETLGCESVTLVGVLRKLDLDAGTWRLRVAENNRDYSGKVRPGVSLSHLVSDQPYRFVCDEEIEEVTGMGREVKTLYLAGSCELAGE